MTARCADGLRDTPAEPSWRFPLGARSGRIPLPAPGSRGMADPGAAPAGAGLPDSRIRFLTLGQFSVWRDDASPSPADFHRQKARAILAFLLSAAGPASRDRLILAFWPDLEARGAAAALNSTMHTLRRALEPELGRGSPWARITYSGNAYSLSLGPEDEWDAREFLRLAHRGLEAEGDSAIDLLRVADAAYAGTYLPEWSRADWAVKLREEIDGAHRAVLEALGGHLLRTRRVREAVDVLRRFVALEPDHEAAHRALITAHLQAGERGLALRQYQECAERLRALGVSPSPATQLIHDNMLRPPPLVGWVA